MSFSINRSHVGNAVKLLRRSLCHAFYVALLLLPLVSPFAGDKFIILSSDETGEAVGDMLAGHGIKFINFNGISEGYPQQQIGIVSNLNESLIPFTNGVFLSTGDLNSAPLDGANSEVGTPGTLFGKRGSDIYPGWLDILENEHPLQLGEMNGDPCGLELIIRPGYGSLNIKYAVASEDYYAQPGWWDKFGIFIKKASDPDTAWTNMAVIVSEDGQIVPAGLNTINQETNSSYFVCNIVTNELGVPDLNTMPPGGWVPPQIPMNLSADGVINANTVSAHVEPNTYYSVRFILADYGSTGYEFAYDTTLMLNEFGITSGADISVDVTSSTSNPTNFSVIVANVGDITATDIVVTNDFPVELTLASTNISSNVTGWQQNGAQSVFTVNTLAPGASETIQFNCAGAVDGTFTNYAVAWPSEGDHTPSNNAAEAAITLEYVGTPVLEIAKSVVSGIEAGQTWTVRGTNLIYEIVVTNTGDGASWSNLTLGVSDTLPFGVTLVSPSATWSLPIINAGGSWTTNLEVTLNMDAPPMLTNSCFITTNSISITNAECRTPVCPDADLQVFITCSTASVGYDAAQPAGSRRNFEYYVSVTNAGPSDATGVNVSIDVPASISVDTSSLVVFDLAVSAGRSFPLPSSAADDVTGTFTNTAGVASATPDLDLSNNEAEIAVYVEPVADPAVVSVIWRDDPQSGMDLALVDVAIINNGPAALADGSQLLVVLNNSTTNTLTLGTLANGATTNLTFDIMPLTGMTALRAQATVAGVGIDRDMANNDGEDQTTLAWPDTSVSLSDDPDPVESGAQYTYIMTIAHVGPAVSGVSALLTLPPELTLGNVQFNGISLNGGDSTNFTVTVSAPVAPAGITLTANATVSGVIQDSDSTNNTVDETTDVNPPPKTDLTVDVEWESSPVAGSTSSVYRCYVDLINSGDTDVATNVTAQVWVDSTSAKITGPAGWISIGSQTTKLSNAVHVLPGASDRAWFDVTITDVTNSLQVYAAAVSTNDSDPNNNQDNDQLDINWADASVSLVDAPDPVGSEEDFAYTVEVSMNAIGSGENMSVDLTLPADVTLVSGDLSVGPFSLVAGATTSWVVSVTAPLVTVDKVLNASAVLTPPIGDTNVANNSAAASTQVTVLRPADVKAFIGWENPPLTGGTNTLGRYYVAVTNVSADTDAEGVTMRTTLLDGSSAFLTLPAGWQTNGVSGAVYSDPMPVFGPAQGTGFWFNVAATGIVSSLNAKVEVDCTDDVDDANNVKQEAVPVLWPDLRVGLQPSRAILAEGQDMNYVITLHNDGVIPVENIWVTNSYPAFVTVTNSGGGLIVNSTNICFSGIELDAGASTSMTVSVIVDLVPDSVTTLVSSAHCLIPVGDSTPENNRAEREIPLYGKDVKGGLRWVLSTLSGSYYAQLSLTNSSSEDIESVWFAFKDQGERESGDFAGLWKYFDGSTQNVNNEPVDTDFADGTRYVDLTAAFKAALLAQGGDDVWNPGEAVVLGVSDETLQAAGGGPVAVENPEEWLLEMFTEGRGNPQQFIELDDCLGSRAGSLHHDSDIDADGDFKINETEYLEARSKWMTGALSTEEYLFISAVYRAQGYRWDMDKRQWIVLGL